MVSMQCPKRVKGTFSRLHNYIQGFPHSEYAAQVQYYNMKNIDIIGIGYVHHLAHLHV